MFSPTNFDMNHKSTARESPNWQLHPLSTPTGFSTKNPTFLVFGTIQQRNPLPHVKSLDVGQFLAVMHRGHEMMDLRQHPTRKSQNQGYWLCLQNFHFDFLSSSGEVTKMLGNHFSVTCSLGFILHCGPLWNNRVHALSKHFSNTNVYRRRRLDKISSLCGT